MTLSTAVVDMSPAGQLQNCTQYSIMELYFLLLLLFSSLLILFLSTIIKSKYSSNPKLPPGPWPLPVIGNIHHLVGSLPHRALRDLSKTYGPLMHLKLGEVSHVVVSSPEAAREVMKTHDLALASRPQLDSVRILSYNGRGILFAPYGEVWRQLRKLCALELMSPKRVHSFKHIREEEVHNLVLSVVSSSSNNGSIVNLSEKLSSMVNNIISRAVIGDKCKNQSAYLEAFDEGAKLVSGFDTADVFPSFSRLIQLVTGSKMRLERCFRKVDLIIEDIVQEHIEKRRGDVHGGDTDLRRDEDLVDVLLRLQESNDELTYDRIKALISDLVAAGSETSSTVLVWAMTELMRNPRVMSKAQAEVREVLKGKLKVTEEDIRDLSYMQLVIKETMRLHAPVPLLLPRECLNTCQLLGYEIPKKTRVLVNAWAIGRDPQYWEDAEEFKPERFGESDIDFKGTSFEFLPFGAGRRMCPGMLLGLTNMELPLAQLLYYFDWKLPDGIEANCLDTEETFGVTAQRKSDLCLHAIPHIPYHT